MSTRPPNDELSDEQWDAFIESVIQDGFYQAYYDYYDNPKIDVDWLRDGF